MLSEIQKLLVVQERDRKIAECRRDLARLPQQRAEADAMLAKANAEMEATKNALKAEEIERKKLEVEADGKRANVNKYKTQLNAIKSNVEYQALLKEINAGEGEIHDIEDKELELMEQAEGLQQKIQAAQVQVKEVTKRVADLKADLDAREKVAAERLNRLEEERAVLTKDLDETIFERYERLFRSKGDMALAAIEHGNCGGCHLHVPPELIHMARGGSEIATCTNCGRILYSAE